MLTLIRKARRRLLYNELLSEGVTAACAALAAFILLLILGTQILNWYWVVLIPAATLAVALYRIRQHLPALYASAQIVDRRMELADSLSTAVYFSEDRAHHAPAELRRWQFQQAERLAAGVDVRRAIPYTMPRSVYAMAALVLVASSLFALRYGLSRRLDLAQPMARILAQALGFDTPETAAAPQRKNIRPGELPQDDNGSPLEAQPPDDQVQAGDPLDEDQNSDSVKPSDKNSRDQEAKAERQNGDDQQGEGQDRASDQENPNSQNARDGQNQQSNGQESSNSSNSSLMSKMKDALQNLLSSMKQQSSNGGQQPQQQQSSAQGSKQKGQQSAKQQKGEKQSGQAGGEEQDPDLSNESQQAENSPGQGTDAQPTNKQPGGGIGNRDGEKDVKQAEQLAAMGKISQIIGKRSANLSGEATIEVQSTAQQLRTAYTARAAQHADSGGEIGRDEIPAALESYVEQYFEQVRKQPPAKK